MKIGFISVTLVSFLLAACAAPTPREPLKGHLNSESTAPAASANIPAPVQQTLALPKPRATPKAETYSVVVNNVAVRELLFALARDAKVNVDIHPGITGSVTLNAIDQTLPQLLTRISKQVDMRFELDGPNLAVMPDSPFLKHYKVDYVNMARNVTGTVSTNTQIATGTSGSSGNTSAPSTGGGGNISNTRIENTSRNQFWESLEKNIKDILRETDKVFPEGSSETVIEKSTAQTASGAAALPQSAGQRAAQAIANALQTNPSPNSASQATGTSIERRSTFREAASVIMNAESGVFTVRATQRQHDRIQEFVDRVIHASKRQVLIEATIVEVVLSDGYKQGIEWSRLRTRPDGTGFEINSPTSSSIIDTAGSAFNLVFRQLDKPLDLVAAVDILQSFGTTKVLSSPRLSVLNNQTALLKAVENIVYFSVKSDVTPSNVAGGTPVTATTTTPQSVSVGIVMSVTPQIGDNGMVTLNIRPSISSVSDWKQDPNPNIPSTIKNLVPQISTREIESVMRVASGDIAVLGGLMEDRISYDTGRVPLLGQVPIAGELLTKRDNAAKKSELIIFLRPVVIKDASLDGDYATLRNHLPGQNFFAQPNEAQPFNIVPSR